MEYLRRCFRFKDGIVFVALLLATGFLFFPYWLVFIELVLGVTIWCFLFQKVKKRKHVSRSMLLLVFAVLSFLFYLASRIYPFFLSSTPFGYDSGIYRYEIWSSIQALPEYLSRLFLGLPLLTDVFSLFGFSLDQISSALFVFVVLLVPLSVVLLYEDEQKGRKEQVMKAAVVLFLFTISLIQWKAYTMILYKQIFALVYVFFSVWLVQKRSFLVLPVLFFLSLLQPLDAFLIGVSIFIYALYVFVREKEERKYFLFLFLFGIVAFFLLLASDMQFWKEAWGLFSQGIFHPEMVEASLKRGVFLSMSDYGYQSAFFFVFGIIAVFYEIWKKKPTVLSFYFFLLLFWISFQFFFYQRLLIQLDALHLLHSPGFCEADGSLFD